MAEGTKPKTEVIKKKKDKMNNEQCGALMLGCKHYNIRFFFSITKGTYHYILITAVK